MKDAFDPSNRNFALAAQSNRVRLNDFLVSIDRLFVLHNLFNALIRHTMANPTTQTVPEIIGLSSLRSLASVRPLSLVLLRYAFVLR